MRVSFSDYVFDYRALRLLVGLIAGSLPILVYLLSSTQLSSISASYYTEARDAFVGMLFIVGSFLWAYNGHSNTEAWASKIASVAAIIVAISPTSCDSCEIGLKSVIHYGGAATLFAILAYFCFFPFRRKIKGQEGKKRRRSGIYFTCGCTIVVSMLILLTAKLTLSDQTFIAWRIPYYAEFLALETFAVAWIVAGKSLSFFADKEDKLQLFG